MKFLFKPLIALSAIAIVGCSEPLPDLLVIPDETGSRACTNPSPYDFEIGEEVVRTLMSTNPGDVWPGLSIDPVEEGYTPLGDLFYRYQVTDPETEQEFMIVVRLNKETDPLTIARHPASLLTGQPGDYCQWAIPR